jgi:hypothetical protein
VWIPWTEIAKLGRSGSEFRDVHEFTPGIPPPIQPLGTVETYKDGADSILVEVSVHNDPVPPAPGWRRDSQLVSTLLLPGVESAETIVLVSNPHAPLHGETVGVVPVLKPKGENVRLPIAWRSEAMGTVALVRDAVVHRIEVSVPFSVATYRHVELSTHGGKLREPVPSIHFRWIVDVVPHRVLVPQAFA